MHIPRPASRQAQHPSLQTPFHSNPSLFLQENGNSTMMPQPHILTKSRPASRSTVSLVPVKRVAPPVEDSPRQARRRVQSFSNQKQPVMSKANSSWPQISAARHVEQQLSRSPIKRRILFYHKHQPYYGFTNFSPHPVKYKGKQYPTSEHLFQSFKVLSSSASYPSFMRKFTSALMSSSKIIALVWPNTFGCVAPGQVTRCQNPVVFSLKFAPIG